MKILIVDDVPFMIMSLRQLLERNGYRVVTANSGEKALEIISSDFSIDVVVTDLVMPDMDGVELFEKAQMVERFNDSGTLPPIPFVLLTSCEKSGNRSNWDSALNTARREFLGILQKPVVEREIIEVLNKVESGRSAGGANASEMSGILEKAAEELRKSGQDITADAIMSRLQKELEEADKSKETAENPA
ncbi:MAG: hypothetical protein Tsb009_03650 [Planctomycetaceae bacterium]